MSYEPQSESEIKSSSALAPDYLSCFPTEDGDEDSMNIFYLSPCAYTSAEWMHEKHTVKMITESAQILSTAVQMNILETDNRLYKRTHIYHQSVKWVSESVWHYEWLMRHYQALSIKYARVFNRNHLAYTRLISYLKEYYDLFPDNGFRPPPLAMPDKYKIHGSHDACYRAYYIGEKLKRRCYYKFPEPFWIPRAVLLKHRSLEL